MRYRLMATYQGQPYEAGIGPSEGDVVLFAACPPPEELGFEPATGHWRKQLGIRDVQALWESRPTGTFRGEPCIILDDLGDRLHIAFLGHDAYLAERLGYWQVDRGVFELITPRDEVVDVVEERTDYPHRSEPAPRQSARPGRADPGFAPAAPAPGFSPATPDPGLGPASAESATGPVAAIPGLVPAAAVPGFGPAAEIPRPAVAPYAVTLPGMASPPGIALPKLQEAPLPLEAAALAATSAATRQQSPAHQDEAARELATPAPSAAPALSPSPSTSPSLPTRHRRTAPRQLATQQVFSELADLAAIPATSYAIGAEVDGAMCLLQTEHGYEVFNAVAGARHEIRLFDDEEPAYFYLFGVLAAEAIRTGGLVPHS